MGRRKRTEKEEREGGKAMVQLYTSVLPYFRTGTVLR